MKWFGANMCDSDGFFMMPATVKCGTFHSDV